MSRINRMRLPNTNGGSLSARQVGKVIEKAEEFYGDMNFLLIKQKPYKYRVVRAAI